MKFLLLTLAFFIFLYSCSQHQSLPEGILPAVKMKNVMWDVMKADELAEFKSYKDSTYKTVAKHDSLYQIVFDINKTSRSAFKNSMNYYQNHPDLLKNIIDSIQKESDLERSKKQDTLRAKPKLAI